MKIGKRLAVLGVALTALAVSAPAFATPQYDYVGQSFATSPLTIAFDGGAFTFSGTGDEFNPLAVQTSGTAEVSSFGGFLGIPIEPTSDFVNRGTVVFGPGSYSPFATPTTVPASNGGNFVGLEVIEGAEAYYGFAYTTDTTLNSYGFETAANTPITATTVSAAPEPAAWALMALGVGLAGASLRYRRHPALRCAIA